MNKTDLIEFCEEIRKHPNEVIILPEYFFENAGDEETKILIDEFGGKRFMRLPEKEIAFFEWLKINDLAVWNDLWIEDDLPEYIVSINLLPELIYSSERGFPICDLVKCDNYFFSYEFMQDEESKIVLEAARSRLLAKQPLTLAQKLALEISISPIDIWHFAFKYKVSIEDAKKAVQELVDDFALVHLKDSENLALALSL